MIVCDVMLYFVRFYQGDLMQMLSVQFVASYNFHSEHVYIHPPYVSMFVCRL